MRQHSIFFHSFSILLFRRISCFRRLSLLLFSTCSFSYCFSFSTTFSSLRECLPSVELCDKFVKDFYYKLFVRSHGVMVSTLDSDSSDPSSNLGGTY